MSGSLVPDVSARSFGDGATLVGGDPPRVLRLTAAGARVARELLGGAPADSSARTTLAARLVRSGLAHPRPLAAAAVDLTLVVPVRDRPRALDRCLTAAQAQQIVVVDDGSRDGTAVAEVCARHGARLVRRDRPGGPAAARNAGLAQVTTGLVAFLDSDCVPAPGWLELLCGVLDDSAVGAAAPRIRPLDDERGAVAAYARARSPLDLGPHPARVQPGGRVAYVPTAALLVRRAALGDGFDPGLRQGEDVDLVWRMHDAGWTVRYEPAAVVGHAEPERLRRLAGRRMAYGTAAGPLARRHPGRLAPVWLHPRPAAVIAAAVAGRPRTAAAAVVLHVGLTVRDLRRAGVPPVPAAELALRGIADSSVAVGRAATMLAPAALALGLAHRRSRPAALALLAAEPLRSWWRTRPQLDPLRFTALALADDLAYGAGVWVGSARARTVAPLLPALPRCARKGRHPRTRARPAGPRHPLSQARP